MYPFAVLESIHIQIRAEITGSDGVAICNILHCARTKQKCNAEFLTLKQTNVLNRFFFILQFVLVKLIKGER